MGKSINLIECYKLNGKLTYMKITKGNNMYKETINDHMTALGDTSSMFIVIEYNNPTYPETTVYNIAHGSDLRLGNGRPNMLSDVMEGTILVTYDNLKDAQKMCERLNYGYESTKRLIETGSIV